MHTRGVVQLRLVATPPGWKRTTASRHPRRHRRPTDRFSTAL